MLGHTPSTAGTFRKKFWKNSERPWKRSESFSWNSPSRVRLGHPRPYNSSHLRAPEHFQNSLPPSTAGDASFFRNGSGEELPAVDMEDRILGPKKETKSGKSSSVTWRCSRRFRCAMNGGKSKLGDSISSDAAARRNCAFLLSWRATKEYLNHKGTKIRVFRVRFRAPFLPPFSPQFSPPLSPSGPAHSPTTSLLFTSPFISPFLTAGKLRFRCPSDLGTL